MRVRQLVVWERDGRLAALLRPLAEKARWSLREAREADACLRLLDRAEPPVLVLAIGRGLEADFDLLDTVSRERPDAAVVVVTESDQPALLGLAWDLGASYVVAGPHGRDLLVEVVGRLLAEPEAPR